jgi:predicted RNA-binding Zn ribbon-like protein
MEFNFRSGRLCLSFVATVGERWRGGIERLREPGDLARWCQESGLLVEQIRVTSAELASARELREGIHRQVRRFIDGKGPTHRDERLLNAAAAHPDLVPVLRHGAMMRTAPASGAAPAALSTVARDAITMLATVDRARLRECASPECGLLFEDTSRPGRRRWCSSEACGGRARAAAYRRRTQSRVG